MAKYPEVQVLESLMKDGQFDELRQMIVQELKSKEDLKVFTQDKVREELKKEDLARDIARLRSGHESSISRGKIQADVLAKLRKKLEEIIMQEISKSAWELMYGESAVAQQIELKVHETCHLLFGALGPEAKNSTQ